MLPLFCLTQYTPITLNVLVPLQCAQCHAFHAPSWLDSKNFLSLRRVHQLRRIVCPSSSAFITIVSRKRKTNATMQNINSDAPT